MEPPPPPTTPPSPFTPGRPRSPGGASRTKPLLIGCGAALILLGIAAVILMVKLPEFVGWMFNRLEAQILAKLPADVTPEERQRLDAAFDAAAGAISSGKADRAKAEELNASLMDFARMDRAITREDVLKLTKALEEVAGTSEKAPP